MVSRRECANAIRALAMDAVQKAKSGHPGMPMGMADIAEVLWRDFLHFNPANPEWVNRDRFVLSNGHGAMLQYAVLHLTGYDLSLEDLKQFRQLHSKTPGHPEYGITPGIETTTGPLGQGLAMGIGMALAETVLAAQFNRPQFPIVDHYTYVFVGDGCLMEGISHEACSLAGTLKLGKLIVFWDDNRISIDGDVSGWFTDDTPMRFHAYHWHVMTDVDGHNPEALQQAISEAKSVQDRPTLICCRTQIAFGSPNLVGKAESHGAPLGEAEIAATREALDWPYPPFELPQEIYNAWNARERGAKLESAWNTLFSAYQQAFPDLAGEFLRRTTGDLPQTWLQQSWSTVDEMQKVTGAKATRKWSQTILNEYAPDLPELFGGSADLTESNCTRWNNAQTYDHRDRAGNYLCYGVREFAMTAIMNGMALHRGSIPFGGTFLTFSDYARNAIRLAALMRIKVIYVYTHDSIGLGEDGPTHQPIEHLTMLRATPDLRVWRPCDGVETAVAWRAGLLHQGPSCLVLTRQNVPQYVRNNEQIAQIAQGGYILHDETNGSPDLILMSTGSEVTLAYQAAVLLKAHQVRVRVVSLPCCEVFKNQPKSYQDTVLPSAVPKMAIEAGASAYWYQFVGSNGMVMGIDRFGASAPAEAVYADCGLTVDAVVHHSLLLLKK